MKRMLKITKVAARLGDPALADKTVDRNQTLPDRIDGEKKTFESYGAEQRRTVGRNEAWSRDFRTVQRQTRLGYGPDVALSAGDHDALRAGGLEFKPFRERPGHHAKSGAGVDRQLNFFAVSGRAGQMSLYVKKSHRNYLVRDRLHCSSDGLQRNNANPPINESAQ